MSYRWVNFGSTIKYNDDRNFVESYVKNIGYKYFQNRNRDCLIFDLIDSLIQRQSNNFIDTEIQ